MYIMYIYIIIYLYIFYTYIYSIYIYDTYVYIYYVHGYYCYQPLSILPTTARRRSMDLVRLHLWSYSDVPRQPNDLGFLEHGFSSRYASYILYVYIYMYM